MITVLRFLLPCHEIKMMKTFWSQKQSSSQAKFPSGCFTQCLDRCPWLCKPWNKLSWVLQWLSKFVDLWQRMQQQSSWMECPFDTMNRSSNCSLSDFFILRNMLLDIDMVWEDFKFVWTHSWTSLVKMRFAESVVLDPLPPLTPSLWWWGTVVVTPHTKDKVSEPLKSWSCRTIR